MRILISNDDGVHAIGLKVLYKELSKIGKVVVVAPVDEKSTTGHSITLHKPLRMFNVAKNFYAVSGSPADCVYMAISQIFRGKPDLVVSGINHGANLGQDVYYSGTVSAAREASILGIPAIAVSTSLDFKKRKRDSSNIHFLSAAKLTVKLIKRLSEIEIPKYTFLNLNVPDLPLNKIRGMRTAPQGFRFYDGDILRRQDHRGRDYFWVGGCYRGYSKEGDSDCSSVAKGYACVTPLKLDSTDGLFMQSLSKVLKS